LTLQIETARVRTMSKLIVTCDDCGLSEGINLATADLYEKGLVTAATVMTNFPAARHAVDLLSSYPSLDVGVHLNLTDGFPLTRIATASDLTNEDGSFKARPLLFIQALIARQSFLELVEAELTEQIEFFLDCGMRPQHLTTHIHFHWFPSLRKIVYALARKYDIRWVRNNELRRAIVPFNMFLPEQIEVEDSASIENVPSPDYLIVLQYWMKYGAPEKLLERLLSLEGAIELVIHPCVEEDHTYPKDIQYQPKERFEEMQYFIEFAQLMRTEAANAIQLSAGL
jgi:predicted glycoside hydrolase/deacetylase ChbG (UPF0249 family)